MTLSLENRGRRECRARDAPAASHANKKLAYECSHHGHTGITRHSPRNGFNSLYRALPGDRAFLPPSPAKVASRKLDASVGASGPHDFAVRGSAPSSEAPPASTASRPAFVTIASRPSVGRDRIDIFLLLPRRQAKFLKIRNWPDCVGRVRRLV